MKKFTLLFVLLLLASILSGQVPAGFKYQAVARNLSDGTVLSNKSVSFRISILQGSPTGTTAYSELHGKITNAFGLVDLEIGKGISLSGSFSGISWGSGTYYIKVEMDPAGGSAFQDMGTSQLLSVPYSLVSKSAETGDNWGTQVVSAESPLSGTGTSLNPLRISQQGASTGQVLKWTGSTWGPANEADNNPVGPAGGDLTGTFPNPTIGDGKVNTQKILDGSVSTADIANSAISTDKIQNGAVTTDKISLGGFGVDVTGAMAETVLKFNGVKWVAGGLNIGPGGASGHVQFNNAGAFGGDANLFWDNTNKRLGIGNATPQYPLHVLTGSTRALNGETTSASGIGVYGSALSASGTTYGVSGYANSSSGTGVYGFADAATGNTFGVKGIVSSSTGMGVYGYASSTSGSTTGVYGVSSSSYGTGIYGYNSSTTGTTFGVKGYVNSSSGYSGYFFGGQFYVSGNVGIGTTTPSNKLDVIGNAEINGVIKVTGEINRSSTGTANMVPVAYGTIGSFGSVLSGSGNFTVVYNTTNKNYEITISGESYSYTSYTTLVTPVSGATIPATNSSGGNLVITIYGLSVSGSSVVATATPDYFSFLVFKP